MAECLSCNFSEFGQIQSIWTVTICKSLQKFGAKRDFLFHLWLSARQFHTIYFIYPKQFAMATSMACKWNIMFCSDMWILNENFVLHLPQLTVKFHWQIHFEIKHPLQFQFLNNVLAKWFTMQLHKAFLIDCEKTIFSKSKQSLKATLHAFHIVEKSFPNIFLCLPFKANLKGETWEWTHCKKVTF